MDDMKRYLDDLVATDLQGKMVLLTGPRQVGKTTLCRQLMERFPSAQYLKGTSINAVLRKV